MRPVLAAFMVLIMASLCSAQQPAAPQTANPGKQAKQEVKVPHGTHIRVTLRTALDCGSAKVGDPVLLEAAEDVRDEKRAVLIPREAKLKARVTEAVRWTKDTKESRLSLVVESAEWKNGHASLRAFIWGNLQIPTIRQILYTQIVDVPIGPGGAVILPQPSVSPSPSPPPDNVQLRTSADPQIGSELFSNEKNVVLREGTTFVAMNWTQ